MKHISKLPMYLKLSPHCQHESIFIFQFIFHVSLISFTVVTGHPLSFTVRDGDDVTLTCENVVDGQVNCNRTNWVFRGSIRVEVDLVTHGQIVEKDKAKSDRLGVTENCSLVIKKVTVQDVGLYHCQQLKPGQEVADTQIELSVINIQEHEHEDGEQVELSCSVSTHEVCRHTVKWLYEGEDAAGDIRYTDMQTSHSECSVTVTFPISNLKQKSKYQELFKCEVTDGYTKKVQLFPFIPQSSGEDATTSTTMRTIESGRKSRITSTTPAVSVTSTSPQVWWPYLIAVIGLVALVIITVAVIRWKMTKGEKRQTDDNAEQSLNSAVSQPGPETSQDTADPEDGVSYASISYTKKTKSRAQVRVRNDDDDDEGDSVTYSSVKASSSPAGASADPRDLYAAVNRANK
ncbi:uncharacterized protein LOC116056170 isoform X2 [Sander lucioperca]|uniref:uncharacterized protein LOC116056170 isoform X2 n=1 Tax=Sander lucioperca TaxID=283035 RepID=UPI00125E4AE6|nr:uncharacterized protein LOC116056170 isoform X2 [Sander lucioperca]